MWFRRPRSIRYNQRLRVPTRRNSVWLLLFCVFIAGCVAYAVFSAVVWRH